MADPKAPEPWVDGWRWDGAQFVRVDPQDATMSLPTLREIAALAGLHIVGEADRKVLEACAAMTIGMPSCAPRPPAKMGPIPKAGVMAVVEAELEARKSRTP